MLWFKGFAFRFTLYISLAVPGTQLLSAVPQPDSAVVQIPTEDQRLAELLDNYFEDQLILEPEGATFLGRDTYLNAMWSDYSEEALHQSRELNAKYTSLLGTIDPSALSKGARIDYSLFEYSLEQSQIWLATDLYLLPVSQMGGPPTDVEAVLLSMPRQTVEHYNNILSRLAGIPELIGQTACLMSKGLDKGLTYPKTALWSLPGNLAKMISPQPEDSLFFEPFKDFPGSFSEEVKCALAERAAELIINGVYPAYKSFVSFVNDTYLPGCREEIGFNALPDGRELYRFCVSRHTTTSLTPSEIHQMGLDEVERIHREMDRILEDINYTGSVQEYLDYLATAPEFYFDDGDSLLEGYRALTKSIEAQLPKLFGRIPSLPFEVVPIPSHSEEGQITAYYMHGSAASGRPGRFFVNTYDIGSRPKWQMESLALHEAVPGHHFQLSLVQELEGLSEFRRHMGCTAFIEGWGLYAESLGPEFGLGATPDARFGRLIEEMMRAVRLVVDTGIHEFGWSRAEAIAYMMEHTGFHEREATTEIDRYCVMPGQALAYKVGELFMQKCKREAREVLRDSFDIRSFHDALLGNGTLPLSLCEMLMDEWLYR